MRNRLQLLGVSAMACVLAAALGCSKDSSSTSMSPTAPAMPPATQPATGATVEGDVTQGGHPAGGVVVSVDGQNLAVQTDAAGGFRLDGVAEGNRVVRFAGATGHGTVTLSAVQALEDIRLTVALTSTAASISAIQRTLLPGTPSANSLHLSISPSAWGTDWASSTGTVTMSVSGTGVELIRLDSIVLRTGIPSPSAAADVIRPVSAQLVSGQVNAIFRQSDAIRAIAPPLVPNQSREIDLLFQLAGKNTKLTATITIVAAAP